MQENLDVNSSVFSMLDHRSVVLAEIVSFLAALRILSFPFLPAGHSAGEDPRGAGKLHA